MSSLILGFYDWAFLPGGKLVTCYGVNGFFRYRVRCVSFKRPA